VLVVALVEEINVKKDQDLWLTPAGELVCGAVGKRCERQFE
jgi:hypothetical protein